MFIFMRKFTPVIISFSLFVMRIFSFTPIEDWLRVRFLLLLLLLKFMVILWLLWLLVLSRRLNDDSNIFVFLFFFMMFFFWEDIHLFHNWNFVRLLSSSLSLRSLRNSGGLLSHSSAATIVLIIFNNYDLIAIVVAYIFTIRS